MNCKGAESQVHKYKRVKTEGNKHDVYKCIRCPHYVIEPFVIGRESECWYCKSTFRMNVKSLLLKPHCGCKNSPREFIKSREGIIINDNKNQILQIVSKKPKEEDPDLKSARESIMDDLLSKLSR